MSKPNIEKFFADMRRRATIDKGGCPCCVARAHLKTALLITENSGENPVAWLENQVDELRARLAESEPKIQ